MERCEATIRTSLVPIEPTTLAAPEPCRDTKTPRQDAVVLIARRPPSVEYFSFTSFALWVPRRGLQFSSLGDSVNNLNLQQTEEGLFAHVLTASQTTYNLVEEALVKSGLPKTAINLLKMPSDVGNLFDDWTHFETVLRLFRFENQTEGDAYLHSHYPVYYLRAPEVGELFASNVYKDRKHPDSPHERGLQGDFKRHNQQLLKDVGEALDRELSELSAVSFAPLMIQGLECLRHDTQCLGDCPDAAYYGPFIREESDVIDMLTLSEDEVHLVSVVNHRRSNVSVYGSLAVLKSSKPTLSKTRMNIRATSLGVTSFDFRPEEPFVSWAFARRPELCEELFTTEKTTVLHGCSVVQEDQVHPESFLTYCERIYLNPVTGTGPHWDDLLPAQLYQVKLSSLDRGASPRRSPPGIRGLPAASPVATFNGSMPMHFTHIVKTGGESLELHLATQPSPLLRYSACRAAAAAAEAPTAPAAPFGCRAAARTVSAALCGLNCECCAKDVLRSSTGFHGTVLRSPRAHALSIFSQCHVAHQNSWRRIVEDVPQYLAEGILRGTEYACGSYCTSFQPDWEADLKGMLAKQDVDVQVIPFLHNMQSHVLTCSNSAGSLGQHFRHRQEPLEPSLEEANRTLHEFDWVGLTDLYEHSMCLLHYQANGSLPAACDCDAPRFLRLPRFTHGVVRRGADQLPQEVLDQIDAYTAVDAQLFASAVRLLLGRLRHLEQITQRPLLKCLPWRRLWQSTRYVPGLWHGPYELSS
ncbi:unnamed protein product [Durusdinium trenchii]|uniref:Uncharacterized protein n=1 Tax=Durusdinium trenchii TaxID=1381693 RepID=A0ABP0PZ40_9DINO